MKMGLPVVNDPVLSKRQLDELISKLYKEVTRKQGAVCDETKDHSIKERLFAQYNEIRAIIQHAGQKLKMAGGLD
jgi:hypothetical protein